jgi:hypothetical protein
MDLCSFEQQLDKWELLLDTQVIATDEHSPFSEGITERKAVMSRSVNMEINTRSWRKDVKIQVRWEHSRGIFGERYESDKAKDTKVNNPNGSQDGEYGRHGDANTSSSCPQECSRAELKLRNQSCLQMHTAKHTINSRLIHQYTANSATWICYNANDE